MQKDSAAKGSAAKDSAAKDSTAKDSATKVSAAKGSAAKDSATDCATKEQAVQRRCQGSATRSAKETRVDQFEFGQLLLKSLGEVAQGISIVLLADAHL